MSKPESSPVKTAAGKRTVNEEAFLKRMVHLWDTWFECIMDAAALDGDAISIPMANLIFNDPETDDIQKNWHFGVEWPEPYSKRSKTRHSLPRIPQCRSSSNVNTMF